MSFPTFTNVLLEPAEKQRGVMELSLSTIKQIQCWSRFVRVAKVGETLTDSQSILTYYILSTTSLRQTNRTSKIHLLLWSADIS